MLSILVKAGANLFTRGRKSPAETQENNPTPDRPISSCNLTHNPRAFPQDPEVIHMEIIATA